MAKTGKKKGRVTVKQMRFRNDPMIRVYESTQDWLQDRGRPVVMIIGVLVGLVVLYTAGYYLFKYRSEKAQAAFAEALEKYNAPVLTDTVSVNQTGKTYADEKTKWQETAEAFERVANDYSKFEDMARFYAGVSYLRLDRDKGLQILQQVADEKDQPTSDWARLALAEALSTGGDTAMAIQKYEELLDSSILPKEGVQIGLGRAYEKAGETEKAVAVYLEVARVDRTSASGAEAEKRLSALAPDQLKSLPAPNVNAPRGR